MCDKRMCRYALQAYISAAFAADPHDSKLGFFITHAHVEDFARPNLPPHALDH